MTSDSFLNLLTVSEKNLCPGLNSHLDQLLRSLVPNMRSSESLLLCQACGVRPLPPPGGWKAECGGGDYGKQEAPGGSEGVGAWTSRGESERLEASASRGSPRIPRVSAGQPGESFRGTELPLLASLPYSRALDDTRPPQAGLLGLLPTGLAPSGENGLFCLCWPEKGRPQAGEGSGGNRPSPCPSTGP